MLKLAAVVGNNAIGTDCASAKTVQLVIDGPNIDLLFWSCAALIKERFIVKDSIE